MITKRKISKWVAAFTITAVLAALYVAPIQARKSTSICNNALLKCGLDSAVAGLLSGGTAMALTFMGCLIGYDWCLKYYVPSDG
jgi:hypothetical protein